MDFAAAGRNEARTGSMGQPELLPDPERSIAYYP